MEIKILNKEFYEVEKLGGSYYNHPDYQSAGAAAIDLVCTQDVMICTNEVRTIRTGLAIHIDSCKHATSFYDYVGLILPRSGLGTEGLVLANTVGLIDSDYQGELIVQAWNRNRPGHSSYSISLKAGDRFAQLMFVPVIKPQFKVVDEFSTITTRAGGGFGSTGT
jgi:dUTP pyrophosphatase